MLKRLFIKNFTLIDILDIDFQPGFSVITGETGAGKSIILGAIALLLGHRADSKSIKNGTDRCTIEARFDLSKYQMKDFFEENDIDYDAADCILRRELTASGKSRSFINDTPVPLTLMRKLGQQLVDIHSQHQNLLLQEEDFQLNVLDVIARNQHQLKAYEQAFHAYSDAQKALQTLRADMEKARENEDFMRFQLSELEEAGLEPGMQEELEQERETLSHVEEIKSGLFVADRIFNEENGGTVGKLKEAMRALDGIAGVFPDIEDLSQRLESCYIELQDIAQEVDAAANRLDFDPRRLETVNEQLDQIYALQRKHHCDSVEALVAIREKLKEQLSGIAHSDEALAQLQQQLARLKDECLRHAEALTSQRTQAARLIENDMTARLIPLGIPKVRFQVSISPKPLSPDGADKVSFLFSANTSTPLQPIAEVASGGEIARVMLSLKAMISGTVKLPTIIFDEIDTGVSGKIAEKMALIMREMGDGDRQVISITHLPQIAALGTAHYKVLKKETENGTLSVMRRLDEPERIQEIAQMLSGSNVTDAAIENARQLLQRAPDNN